MIQSLTPMSEKGALLMLMLEQCGKPGLSWTNQNVQSPRLAFGRKKDTLLQFILVCNYEDCSCLRALTLEKQRQSNPKHPI